jgi:hypothetical protein
VKLTLGPYREIQQLEYYYWSLRNTEYLQIVCLKYSNSAI